MKNNTVAAIFLALFLVSTALNAWVILKYNSSLHTLRQLQANSMAVVPVVQQLVNESLEYSKTHPDMQHYLQGGPLAPAPRAAAPAPTAKPTK
jgi:hypothetical protein